MRLTLGATLLLLLASQTVMAAPNLCSKVFEAGQREERAKQFGTNVVASEELISRLNMGTTSWSDLAKAKFKTVSPTVIANMESEGIAIVVAGGSSIHAVLPAAKRHGNPTDVSVKLYFRAPGPQTLRELTQDIVDAAMPSLELIASSQKRDQPPVLVVPAPGKIVGNGQAIQLPGNFGVIGNQVYPLPEMVSAEIAKRAQALGLDRLSRTKVVVKNDSFTLAATIGSDRAATLGRRVKLIFAGTGLGETNIVNLKNGKFIDRATESGHIKIANYPGLEKELPASLARAARVLQKAHNLEDLEFENFVAGGRAEHHLSGLLSIIVSSQLSLTETPSWILRGTGGKSFSGQSAVSTFSETAAPDSDFQLRDLLKRNGSITLEDVSRSARAGSPFAKQLMVDVTFTQSFFAGILASEFGATPSGEKLPAQMAFGSLNHQRLDREVHVRADGALSEWSRYMEDAKRGFEAGLNYQFSANPEYRARLSEAGLNPAWRKADSFKLVYGTSAPALADPDLQGAASLTRNNFE